MCRTVIKVIETEKQRKEALKLIKAFTVRISCFDLVILPHDSVPSIGSGV